jgi:hypothetical protein
MRKQKGNSKIFRLKFLPYVSILLVALSLWFAPGRRKEPKDLRTQIRILAEHKDPRVPNKQIWFAPTFQMLQGPDGVLNENARTWIWNRWNQVKFRLDSYHEDNLRQLASIFDQSTSGAVTGRTGSRLNFGLILFSTSPAAVQQSLAGLKIAFYGDQQFQTDLKGLLDEPLTYAPPPNAIFVPAYDDFDPLMMDAMYFHELTHVRQNRQATVFGGKGMVFRDNKFRSTDEGADAEIEAHDVGRQVFEIGTKGEYGRRIAKIVLSKDKVTDPIKLLLKVTPRDIDRIDEALNRPAVAEVNYRRTQYLYDLGRECINAHTPEPDRHAKLRDLYRSLLSARHSFDK